MNSTLVYHLSVIEAIWVVVALVGLIFTCYNTTHAWRDYNYIKQSDIFNGRRIVARVSAWTEGMRAVIQAIFVAIGVGVGTIPDTPISNAPLNIRIVQELVRWGLIASSILLTVKSYMLARMRNKINPHPPKEGS